VVADDKINNSGPPEIPEIFGEALAERASQDQRQYQGKKMIPTSHEPKAGRTKALLGLTLFTLCVLGAFVSGISVSDQIFPALISNDPQEKKSIFMMDNPTGSELSGDDLQIQFNEVCGRVRDISISVWDDRDFIEYEQTYDLSQVCKNNIIKINKTELIEKTEKMCQEQRIPGIIRPILSSRPDYYPIEKVDPGIKNYQIQTSIDWGRCDDGWGYKVEWVPGLTISGLEVTQPRWDWYNATWLSKYTLQYTCQNPGGCVNERMVYNYSNLTSCDQDLRFVYLNSTEVEYEINDTDKMLYSWVNGSFNLMNEDYAVFCDNDDAPDGSVKDFKILYEDCEDLSDWVKDAPAYTEAIRNDSMTAVNHTGYGGVCSFAVNNAGGNDKWITRTMDSTTDTGILYFTFFWWPESGKNYRIGMSSLSSSINPITLQLYPPVLDWLGAYDTGSRNIRPISSQWVILSQVGTLGATDQWQIDFNHVLNASGYTFRSGFNQNLSYVQVGADDASANGQDIVMDELMISKYPVNLYFTRGIFTFGPEELGIPPEPPILRNATPEMTFLGWDEVYYGANLTCRAIIDDALNDTLEIKFWIFNDTSLFVSGEKNLSTGNLTELWTVNPANTSIGQTWNCTAQACYEVNCSSNMSDLITLFNYTSPLGTINNQLISQNGYFFNFNSTSNVMLFGIIVFLWLGLAGLTFTFRNFLFAGLMWIVGLVLGLMAIPLTFVLSIAFLLFSTIILINAARVMH